MSGQDKATWLNDAIYRDVILADAKAVFAMSISGLGVGGAASILGSLTTPGHEPLGNPWVYLMLATGTLLALLAILLACVTVLPRRYVTQFEDHKGSSLTDDLWRTLLCNIAAPHADGGSQLIDRMYEALRDSTGDTAADKAWLEEIGRLAEVRRRKYWWAGWSIILSTAGVLVLVAGVAAALAIEVS
jgi:hypothetical protein